MVQLFDTSMPAAPPHWCWPRHRRTYVAVYNNDVYLQEDARVSLQARWTTNAKVAPLCPANCTFNGVCVGLGTCKCFQGAPPPASASVPRVAPTARRTVPRHTFLAAWPTPAAVTVFQDDLSMLSVQMRGDGPSHAPLAWHRLHGGAVRGAGGGAHPAAGRHWLRGPRRLGLLAAGPCQRRRLVQAWPGGGLYDWRPESSGVQNAPS